MDATPDYTQCSLRELRDVAARIDKVKFPERHALVLREIERRETSGDDAATSKAKRLITVWDFFSVLFTIVGGALLGAVLSGVGAYLYNPPYGSTYRDGIDWGLGFIGCVFLGAFVGAITGLVWSVNKIHKR